jgi:uncharacterized membrane protein YkoI
MRDSRWLFISVVLLVLANSGRADEEKVRPKNVPKVVAAAVKKRFPGADVADAGKETEDGKAVFEVAAKDKGQKVDVSLTLDGEITEIEKTIAEKELPAQTATTLKARYPGAKYQAVEEIIHVKGGKETLDYYEVLLTAADNKKWEFCVTAAGDVK